MQDILLLTALLTALATGWWLGRWELKSRRGRGRQVPDSYIEGLDVLFKEQPDDSIRSFLQALGNQANTIEAHLALGRLFRSRGEVEKATRVHQMLLARPDLPRDKLQLIQFELANDYMVAGLLDRAERLLSDLSREEGEVKWRSVELLMQVYQHEKEWDLAIQAAATLLPRRSTEIRSILAHYCCEKACEMIARDDINAARRELKRAFGFDSDSVRASLLKGRIETQAGNYKEAVKAYRRVRDQDADYLTEAIPGLAECYRQQGKEGEFMRYLLDSLKHHPSATLVVTAADLLQNEAIPDRQVQELVREQLKSRPSLRGLLRFVDLQISNAGAGSVTTEALVELRNLCAKLVESKPVYRCTHCGYSGKRLVWLCPGCQSWGKIKPIYGVEGE